MAEEEDARTQLQALQLEMEEFESQSAELEHALEEEKRMLEIDLEEAEQKVATFSKKVYDHNSSPMVLYNGCNYIGDTTAFFAWARRVYDIKINSTYLQDALMGTTPQNNSFVRWDKIVGSISYPYIYEIDGFYV